MKGSTEIMLFIAIVVGILLIRFLIRFAADKGSDAVENAIRKKKAEDHPPESENLADRFKK